MVKILDTEETVPAIRGTIKYVLVSSVISYVGYMLVGLWCLHIEFEDADKREKGILDRTSDDYVEPELELGLALAFIILSICRLGLLGLFFFETDENIETLSTIWLTFSTVSMMIFFLGTCVEIAVFYHAHALLPAFIFTSIAFDFLSNILVLIRKTSFLEGPDTDE